MSKHLKVLLLLILVSSLSVQVSAQTKPKTTKTQKSKETPPAEKKPQTTEEEWPEPPPPPPPKARTKPVMEGEDTPPPPPPQEMMTEADSADMAMAREAQMQAYLDNAPKPMVDFDTTAVVDDEFTKDIMKVLTVTNAVNLGNTMVEELNKNEENPMLKEFYARIMTDMRSGATRRWLERLYVREYRKAFTHDDIKVLLKFYDSPTGRKLVRSTYEMLPGLMQTGRKIGEYKAAVILTEMMKEGK